MAETPGQSMSAPYHSYKTERGAWAGSKTKDKQQGTDKYQNINESNAM